MRNTVNLMGSFSVFPFEPIGSLLEVREEVNSPFCLGSSLAMLLLNYSFVQKLSRIDQIATRRQMDVFVFLIHFTYSLPGFVATNTWVCLIKHLCGKCRDSSLAWVILMHTNEKSDHSLLALSVNVGDSSHICKDGFDANWANCLVTQTFNI